MKKVKSKPEIKYNCRSPKQTAMILTKMGIKLPKTDKGNLSTGDKALINHQHVPFVHMLLEYRHVKKILSTYVERFLKLSHHDGYLYPTFNQTVVDTNRLSSQEIHNVSKQGNYGKEIRNSIIARPGHVFASFDFNQLQLRIIAHYTSTFEMGNELVYAYRIGKDVHQMTADVLGVDRFTGKTINFMFCFGGRPKLLMYKLAKVGVNKTLAECEQYHKEFFETYKGLERWSRYIRQYVRTYGYAPSLFGFKRPLALPQNRKQESYFNNCCVNSPIQASEAQILKKAMINVYSNLALVPCMQIHDELIYELLEEKVEQTDVLHEITMRMEEFNPLCVPLKVSSSVAYQWGKL